MNLERLLTFGFGQPFWLLLLALVPLFLWLEGRAGGTPAAVRFPSVAILRKIGAGLRTAQGGWPLRLTALSLALLVLAMARPRIEQGDSPDKREGVDIVFCIDISGSMESKDFLNKGVKISRREALILAIEDFVDRRPNDRFGMIGFAGHTYLMSPMTIDGEWIKNVLKVIKTLGGTAIGDGILASVELLKEAKGQSKIIVVVTDGQNNAGIDPLKAADQAKAAGVRVHTIAITHVSQVGGEAAVKSLLGKVADKTGGLYYQASNLENIIGIYRQIDKMEKSRFEERKFRVYDELYPWFVIPAFLQLILSFVAAHTWRMRLP